MKFFYDLTPLLIFFAAYKLYGIFIATATAITVTALQVAFTLARRKKPEVMHLVTLAMVSILGSATLLLRNEMFIKWKPTAVYWLLASLFAGSPRFLQKNLVKKLLEKSLSLPEKAWLTLNRSWYSFFFLMGTINLVLIYMVDTDTWVNFKLFGTLALTLVFVIVQGLLVSRYIGETQKDPR